MTLTSQSACIYRPAWARAVMLWLLLAFSVSLASPLVQPKSLELVCTGTGSVKLLIDGSDDAGTAASMASDCALCLQASAPPPCAQLSATAPISLVYTLQPVALYSEARRTAPPLPARDPPGAQRA